MNFFFFLNSIQTNHLRKNKNLKKISDPDEKIPDTSGLVKKTDYNAKITIIESKTFSITDLATNSALTAIENKIPNIISLIKKQNIMQILVKLKRNSLIIIMIDTLLFQKFVK